MNPEPASDAGEGLGTCTLRLHVYLSLCPEKLWSQVGSSKSGPGRSRTPSPGLAL